jgi:hypothetical protein
MDDETREFRSRWLYAQVRQFFFVQNAKPGGRPASQVTFETIPGFLPKMFRTKALPADVLVEIFPMYANTSTYEPPFFPFREGPVRKPCIPCKRNGYGASITEIYAKSVVRDADPFCEGNFLFNTRSIHSL